MQKCARKRSLIEERKRWLLEATTAALVMHFYCFWEDAVKFVAESRLQETIDKLLPVCEDMGPELLAELLKAVDKGYTSDFRDRLINAMQDDEFRSNWINDVREIYSAAEQISKGKTACTDCEKEALFYLALDEGGKRKWRVAMIEPLLY